MLWHAGTLESWLDRLLPFTGNAASAGISSSPGTLYAKLNNSSNVMARPVFSKSKMRSAQRLCRFAAASTSVPPVKATRPSVTVTSLAPMRRMSNAAALSAPK